MASQQPNVVSSETAPPMFLQQQLPAGIAPAQSAPPGQTPYAMYPMAYGQTYTPYVPATQPSEANPQNAVDPNTPPVQSKGWVWSKVAMHICLVVFGIVLIGTGAYEATSQNFTNFLVGILGLSVGAATLIWSAAELITISIRSPRAGIHPGAHVGVCLILWLVSVVIGGMVIATVLLDSNYYGDEACDNYPSNYDGPYDESYACQTTTDPVLAAIAAFTVLVFVLNFVLFIFACIDTHKRNRWNNRQIIYVPTPMQWGPPAQGWQRVVDGNQGSNTPDGEGIQMDAMPQNTVQEKQWPITDATLGNTSKGKGSEMPEKPDESDSIQQKGGLREYYS